MLIICANVSKVKSPKPGGKTKDVGRHHILIYLGTFMKTRKVR